MTAAILWQAWALAPAADVALASGGGSRRHADGDRQAHRVAPSHILPLANAIVIVTDVPWAMGKALLESSVARVEPRCSGGAHIAG